MASSAAGSAWFLIFLVPLILFASESEVNIDSLAGEAPGDLLLQIFEERNDPEHGSMRFRYREDELTGYLKAVIPGGFVITHRNSVIDGTPIEERSSLEWKRGAVRIIYGSGYVHVNRGMVWGHTMSRPSVRFSRNTGGSSLRIRSDPASWNDDLRALILEFEEMQAFLFSSEDVYAGGLILDRKGIVYGNAVYKGRDFYITEHWLRTKGPPLLAGLSISLGGMTVPDHVQMHLGYKTKELEYGVQVTLVPAVSDGLHRDTDLGSDLVNDGAAVLVSLWKKAGAGLQLGSSFIKTLARDRDLHNEFIIQTVARHGAVSADAALHLEWDRRDETAREWPWETTVSDTLVSRLALGTGYSPGRALSLSLRTVSGPPGSGSFAWLQRADMRKGPFHITLQYLAGRSPGEPIYLAAPYVGTAYLSRRIGDAVKTLDLRLNIRKNNLLLSASAGRDQSGSTGYMLQLQMDLQ